MASPHVNPTPQHIRWGVAGPGRAGARFAQGLAAVLAAGKRVMCEKPAAGCPILVVRASEQQGGMSGRAP